MNFDTMINTGKAMLPRRVPYSMSGSRTGADGIADCSGFVYKCLTSGGVKPMSWIPNADSVPSWLENNGYVWIRQPRTFGYGYLPTGIRKNGKRISSWGSFD